MIIQPTGGAVARYSHAARVLGDIIQTGIQSIRGRYIAYLA